MLELSIPATPGLHAGYTLKLYPGCTILTGPNGAGKTTLLDQLARYGEESGYRVLRYSNDREGKLAKARYTCCGNGALLAASLDLSEGEGVAFHFKRFLPIVRAAVQDSKATGTPLLVLLDSLDSGASIDRLIDLRCLYGTIQQDMGGTGYLVSSSNRYELCRGTPCLDVRAGEYHTFASYEEYAAFIAGYFASHPAPGKQIPPASSP